jgi:hypothetical protein
VGVSHRLRPYLSTPITLGMCHMTTVSKPLSTNSARSFSSFAPRRKFGCILGPGGSTPMLSRTFCCRVYMWLPLWEPQTENAGHTNNNRRKAAQIDSLE